MIYAVINTYVILDSCISYVTHVTIVTRFERAARGRRLSLSTSCVPRPRDNISTGDVHTTDLNTVNWDLFPNHIDLCTLIQLV